MASPVLIDAGPLVAIINRRDQWHSWSQDEFSRHAEPFLTCDAVLSEAFHLLENVPHGSLALIKMLDRKIILCRFACEIHWPALSAILRKYADQPMSLADACLVRMAEFHPQARIFTTDGDFRVYRKSDRRIIPLISPPQAK